MRRIVLVAALAAACSSANLARADDARARAAESFREGKAAYDRHDFAAAAAAFDLAASFEPNAVSWLDAADAWALAIQFVRAAEDCDRALSLPDLTPAERKYATALLAKLEMDVATLQVNGPQTVSVSIDGGTESHAPVRRRVAAGQHVVELVDLVSGKKDRRDVDLRGGQTQNLEARVVLAPPTPAPTRLVHASGNAIRVPFATWLALGGTAAAASAAGVFGALTLNARNAFNANPTHATSDDFYRDRTLANVAWAVAGLGAVAAAVFWVGSIGSERASVAVSPRGDITFTLGGASYLR
jgi:tetratricopeptide (TPR) repeat protein